MSVALNPKADFSILFYLVELISRTLKASIGIRKEETIILETKAEKKVALSDDTFWINWFRKYS